MKGVSGPSRAGVREFYDDDRHGVGANIMMTRLDAEAATVKFGRDCPM